MSFPPRGFVALAAGLAMSACSASTGGGKSSSTTRDQATVTLFFSTELRGNIEPCGCTSNPMGDLARTAAVIAEARKASPAFLYVDGGSTLYDHANHTNEPGRRGQEEAKAKLLVSALTETLGVDALGLGPDDLVMGTAGVRPPRQAANLPADTGIPIAPPAVFERGGVRIGVFGVVSPALLAPLSIRADDPVAAARRAITTLRGERAEAIVAIAHMNRKETAALVKAVPEIDFALVAHDAPEPNAVQPEAVRIGDSYLIRPANRGQVLSRVDVTVRGPGRFTDAIGPGRAKLELAELDRRVEALKKNLAEWRAAPDADPDFLATKQRELDELDQQRTALDQAPLRIPTAGNWFVLTQIEIDKKLPCDAAVQDAKIAFDKQMGAANLAAAAGHRAPPVPPGGAGYVGRAECEDCHEDELAMWESTGHSRAWVGLERVGKALDYDCILCHVTGWEKPGGSSLADTKGLRDVQCEVCHGPGSLHIAVDDDDAKFRATIRKTPSEGVCLGCHTEEHSDLFDYEAYLRNITGPGHGEELRKKLGDGPTASTLAAEARARVGDQIGAGCVK